MTELLALLAQADPRLHGAIEDGELVLLKRIE